jgi:protein SCO1/2
VRPFPHFAIGLVVFAAAAAASADQIPSANDPVAAIDYSQAAIGRVLGDYSFLDQNGAAVRLADYRGRPLVINLVYTACSDVCPTLLETLYRSVDIAQEALGSERFAVVTIGFDAQHDSPSRMRAFASSHGIDLPNWRFLSASSATVEHLSADLGFIFSPAPQGFDHLARITVVDADGRVYRHVYGADFEAPALVEPLKDLVFNRDAPLISLSGLLDRVRLFCTTYDPTRDRYRFNYSIFASILGTGLGVAGVGFVLIRALIRLRRREANGLTR